jgi:hypothetical protein
MRCDQTGLSAVRAELHPAQRLLPPLREPGSPTRWALARVRKRLGALNVQENVGKFGL